ncbi:MAG: MFS transporter [Alphaproteobacteria bacterium]|nr:MFS transporter [Alphaproteobacteria bacterium]
MRPQSPTRLPPGFNRLAWSNLSAQSAEQIGLAAAPLVAVLALGAGAGETGLLQTAATLPFLLMAIPTGLLADRYSRRNLMAAAESVRVLSLLAILALLYFDLLTWPLLAILGFLGATGTVAYGVAAPALVPTLVPPDALAAANARIELARTVAFTAGPALAGTLVGWAGAAPAFALAAALSIWATLLLAGLREPPRPPQPKRHPLQDLRVGARFMATHALLLPVFATQFVFNMAFFILLAVYVPYAVDALRLSASEIGMTLATYGIGMIVGALLTGRVLRVLRFGTVIALGPIAGAVAALIMLATMWLPSPLVAGLSFFLLGVGPIVWVISTTTLRQSVTPQDLLGRISAINILAYGARPIGAGIGAFVGSQLGLEACLFAAAAAFAIQAGIILMSPVVRLERQPEFVK